MGLLSQDRYMFWSSGDERWKVDKYRIYADSVAKRQAVGFIFSTSNAECPVDAVWSQNQDIKPDPNLSVKMRCRTNYGNQEKLIIQIFNFLYVIVLGLSVMSSQGTQKRFYPSNLDADQGPIL